MDTARLARFIIAALEGGMLMTRVKRDVTVMEGIGEDLKRFVAMHLREGEPAAADGRGAGADARSDGSMRARGRREQGPVADTGRGEGTGRWMHDDRAATRARRAHFEAEALVHLDALYGFALKLARARDDAEDLVSDTLLRALERWEQYRLGTNIRAWLFTILYHVFVSRKRRIDAREVPEGDGGDAGGRCRTRSARPIPEGRFYDSFLDERDRPRDRRAARTSTAGGGAVATSRSCATRRSREILGMPEGTVKSRLFRGRRLLQRRCAGTRWRWATSSRWRWRRS